MKNATKYCFKGKVFTYHHHQPNPAYNLNYVHKLFIILINHTRVDLSILYYNMAISLINTPQLSDLNPQYY